jgi:sulfite exporter TauE/SafE
MFSLAMIVKAATTGRPFIGFLTMLSFGLGTLPVLILYGAIGVALLFQGAHLK